jgi:hypothetical protein
MFAPRQKSAAHCFPSPAAMGQSLAHDGVIQSNFAELATLTKRSPRQKSKGLADRR